MVLQWILPHCVLPHWGNVCHHPSTPGNFVESCIAAVLLFQYIFGEQNQTLPSPKTRIRGITPGEIFACCLVLVAHLWRTKTIACGNWLEFESVSCSSLKNNWQNHRQSENSRGGNCLLLPHAGYAYDVYWILAAILDFSGHIELLWSYNYWNWIPWPWKPNIRHISLLFMSIADRSR